MAKVGLKGIRYAVLGAGEVYDAPLSIGKGVSCSVSVNNNDAKLYADDALAESDSTFSSATVSLVIDDDRDAVLAELLGRTVAVVGGEIVRTASDIAPYVGLGRVITKMVDGAYKYKAEFIAKVKFKEPSQEENTKSDKVDFGTTTLEGDASTISTGQWSKTNTFATLALAEDYLDTCFGVVGV